MKHVPTSILIKRNGLVQVQCTKRTNRKADNKSGRGNERKMPCTIQQKYVLGTTGTKIHMYYWNKFMKWLFAKIEFRMVALAYPIE